MSWMIYGSNGYTGKLISAEAIRKGLRPVLAGRNQSAIAKLARELDLEYRVFALDKPELIQQAITGMKLVLHCAGPFSETSLPMAEACLAQGIHYLDITGEIPVFAALHELHDRARRADVVLLPGAGFDVVPSDCLASSLVEVLPAATRLQLAFEAGGGMSPGTAKTSVEGLKNGGLVRRNGKLKKVPLAWKTRSIPFAHGERAGVTIPWGDVYTAYVSTGIPNIEVYIAASPSAIANLRRLRWVQRLLGLAPVQYFLKRQIEKKVKGPGEAKRKASLSQLWGQASTADGRSVQATMTAPNGYDLTVSASLGIAEYLLSHDVEGGFYTPSLLMGAEYASTLPGVQFNLQS